MRAEDGDWSVRGGRFGLVVRFLSVSLLILEHHLITTSQHPLINTAISHHYITLQPFSCQIVIELFRDYINLQSSYRSAHVVYLIGDQTIINHIDPIGPSFPASTSFITTVIIPSIQIRI